MQGTTSCVWQSCTKGPLTPEWRRQRDSCQVPSLKDCPGRWDWHPEVRMERCCIPARYDQTPLDLPGPKNPFQNTQSLCFQEGLHWNQDLRVFMITRYQKTYHRQLWLRDLPTLHLPGRDRRNKTYFYSWHSSIKCFLTFLATSAGYITKETWS